MLRERYRLDSEIGRGAMGIVFRATDLELLRPVAVKILAEKLSGIRTTQEATAATVAGETPAAPDAAGTSDQRSRFMREARAAAALNHPHIVGIYDVGEDHGFPFFVMELVDGPNLGQTPSHDLEQVVDIACQICAALEHAHANNIVHRDLKPANILLSGVPPTFAKLADLGLALPAGGSRISHAGTIVGTAAYMAPEQALGKIVDGRTDLYALGVVLYELTTGRVPFPGNDPLATISQHLHAPVVPPRCCDRICHARLRPLFCDTRERSGATFRDRRRDRNALRERWRSGGGMDAMPAAQLRFRRPARGRLVARDPNFAEARELWRRRRKAGPLSFAEREPAPARRVWPEKSLSRQLSMAP